MDKKVVEGTMETYLFTSKVCDYKEHLILSEYSALTVKKYINDINLYLRFLGKREIFDKHTVIEYKNHLMNQYKICSVNSYLISLNKYFGYLGRIDLKIKTNRVQRRTSLDNVISKEEYYKILDYLKNQGKRRDYLLIKTLAMTGIRIGELKYITYEALIKGETYINFKGKMRTIYIADSLTKQLFEFCLDTGIMKGIIFHGRTPQKELNPSGIWKRMKRIAKSAGIPEKVVYPHSFRHYFAKNFMSKIGNIVELADLLGHSSIEMTRIYTLTSSKEKRKMLDSLDEYKE